MKKPRIFLGSSGKQTKLLQGVVFEAGLFGGALGIRRTFILHANGSKLPSDLLGLTSVRYTRMLRSLKAPARSRWSRRPCHRVLDDTFGSRPRDECPNRWPLLRADASDLQVLDGGCEDERAQLIAQRLREWKSAANAF